MEKLPKYERKTTKLREKKLKIPLWLERPFKHNPPKLMLLVTNEVIYRIIKMMDYYATNDKNWKKLVTEIYKGLLQTNKKKDNKTRF